MSVDLWTLDLSILNSLGVDTLRWTFNLGKT